MTVKTDTLQRAREARPGGCAYIDHNGKRDTIQGSGHRLVRGSDNMIMGTGDAAVPALVERAIRSGRARVAAHVREIPDDASTVRRVRRCSDRCARLEVSSYCSSRCSLRASF